MYMYMFYVIKPKTGVNNVLRTMVVSYFCLNLYFIAAGSPGVANVNVNDLFSKLLSSGIIQKLDTPATTSLPVPPPPPIPPNAMPAAQPEPATAQPEPAAAPPAPIVIQPLKTADDANKTAEPMQVDTTPAEQEVRILSCFAYSITKCTRNLITSCVLRVIS